MDSSPCRVENFHVLIISVLFLITRTVFCNNHWDGIIVTESDYQSLQALKHEFVDLRGVLTTWNTTNPAGACSGWAGIKCAGGQVIAITLPWKGLAGKISSKIGQLQSLRRLSLHDNSLSGDIPATLGFLPNLRGLYLFNNKLSGNVPPSLGNCLLLQTLDLSNNILTGIVPPNLSNSTKLFRLNLSFNSLSGSIPVALTRSHSLFFLALQNNNLSGPVPDSWESPNLHLNTSYNLRSIVLDHNLLSGEIPSSLTKLAMLEELRLSHNQMTGKIPDEIGTLSRLNSLDLSNNKFSGRIPDTVGNLTRITSLDLSENNLTGGIPDSLTTLKNLTFLDVSYNNLSGAVPPVLAKKFNSSSFAGNLDLCGFNGSSPCPSPPPVPENQPSEEPNRNRRKLSLKDIILITAGVLLVILLVLCCVLLCCLIRKRSAGSKARNGGKATGGATVVSDRGAKPSPGAEVESGGGDAGGKLVHFDGPFVFTADDLLCATAEIMGKSSYGTAYKATLEDNDNQVLVKRLREKITKGQKEFESEVARLGKIRHPNILALRAYYLGPKGEKLLVYDHMPNGSLASFLHARGPETVVPWATRMSIAVGITRGLCYLHDEEKMCHGNLTSSSVMLDEQNCPKVADVGLSRLMTSAANTDAVATAGTTGYRAPELSKMKNASSKSDVYSLGVIMLELLTGKSPSEAIDGHDLPEWVASIVKEEWTNEVFDVEVMKDASEIGDEALGALKLALHCVDPSPAARPEARQVLSKLEEIMPDLVRAPAPAPDDGSFAEIPARSE
ncbi:probably inactive leucine-rich repeat receptor-like protein kinase IMK2 [Andrographis paniculata]|uniref:probably inactive leucine-rich repeat receptor-like protein kinase IMK2 n=1 Tax=Andrographis paniculata TaxID=175694 RepID=UPI0021E73074|nr:probably inactive leucine-rich repeat receptor-like protein kinase IMK2 [Andrographis paniculata]